MFFSPPLPALLCLPGSELGFGFGLHWVPDWDVLRPSVGKHRLLMRCLLHPVQKWVLFALVAPCWEGESAVRGKGLQDLKSSPWSSLWAAGAEMDGETQRSSCSRCRGKQRRAPGCSVGCVGSGSITGGERLGFIGGRGVVEPWGVLSALTVCLCVLGQRGPRGRGRSSSCFLPLLPSGEARSEKGDVG